MEKKNSNTGLIITIVVLVMLILFGGTLVLLSSMGYVSFGKESNKESNNEEITKDDDTSLLSEDSALLIVRDKVSKYFTYYHSLGVYCGEYNREDYISFGSYENRDFHDYYASTKFNNVDELKEYYTSFMIEDLFPGFINKERTYIDENGKEISYSYIEENIKKGSYIEKDGKLYCELSHKGCGDTYNDESSTYTISSIDENKIVSNVTLVSDTCEAQNTRTGTVEITKDSTGNWLVSKYEVMIGTGY